MSQACFSPEQNVQIGPVTPWRGGGPRVVVSTAAFHARVRGSVPGLGGFKETKMFLPHPCVKVSIVGSLHDRVVACSASDRQGSNFEYSVVTPDVDHAVLIAIEKDQPNNPPPPDPLDSFSWYIQPNASIQFLLYSMNVYIFI